MEALSKKLQKLQMQKLALEAEMQKIHEARNEEFVELVRTLPASQIDPMVLLGGLHYVIEQARLDPKISEVWRQAGQKFLKGKSSLTRNSTRTKKAQPILETRPSNKMADKENES